MACCPAPSLEFLPSSFLLKKCDLYIPDTLLYIYITPNTKLELYAASSMSLKATVSGNSSPAESATSTARVAGGVPVQTLRSLYLQLENGDSSGNGHGRNKASVTYPTPRTEFPKVKKLNPLNKKRILVTGVSAVRPFLPPVFATIWVLTVLQGAGFVGSHLVDRLMLLGHDVICIDNFFTGTKANVSNWIGHPNFELIRYAFGCSIDGGNF